MASSAVVQIDIQDKLQKLASGKVRDLFIVDDQSLLFVTSDRISAYDVIMKNVSLLSTNMELFYVAHQQYTSMLIGFFSF